MDEGKAGETAWAKGALPAGIRACNASLQIIEQIMEHVAEVSGADPVEVRRLNFLKAYPMAPAPETGSSASGVLEGSSSSNEVGHVVPGPSPHGSSAVRTQRASFESASKCTRPSFCSRCVCPYTGGPRHPAQGVWMPPPAPVAHSWASLHEHLPGQVSQ